MPQCLAGEEGELAASATCTPASACAAFQCAGNSVGETCRCSCTEVHAASGRIVSEISFNDSMSWLPGRGTPVIDSSMSSPRAAKICWLSRSYRGLLDNHWWAK